CLRDFEASRPELLAEFAEKLYPILIDIAVTIVSEEMRVTCLSAVAKLVASMKPDELLPVVRDSHLLARLVASMKPDELLPVVRDSHLLGYLSGFIASSRPPIAGLSLLICEMLLNKLPQVLGYRFASEGVVHEVGRLCAKELTVPNESMDALLERARKLQATVLEPGAMAASCAASGLVATVLEPGAMAAACAASGLVVERASSGIAGASDVKHEELTYRRLAQLKAGDASALPPLRELFCAGEGGISSFQMLTSGLAESLLEFLSSSEPGHIEAFVRVFCSAGPGQTDAGAEDQPLRTLVRKLNEGLTMHESFPVVMSDAAGDLTAGLKLLAQPLKLRLSRDASDSALGDYGGNVVLIEPLATIKAVHDFLWPKGNTKDYGGNVVLIEHLATIKAVHDFLWPKVFTA
ncbi:hypothetical protein T484DRAFT_1790785, partial [Baffinella frigidus]